MYHAKAFYIGFDSEIEHYLTDDPNMTKKLDIDIGHYGEGLVLIDRTKLDTENFVRRRTHVQHEPFRIASSEDELEGR